LGNLDSFYSRKGGGGQEYKGSRAVVMLRGGESESL
jgi:hypothetical protein